MIHLKRFKTAGRLCAALGLMLFTGGIPGVSPICAVAKTPAPAVQKQAEVDLDGSGKPQKITCSIDEKKSTFTLTVAGSSQSMQYDYGTPEGFSIVAIDKADKHRQIVVMIPGASDESTFSIFSYEGNKLHKLGELSRSVEFPGDGSVLVQDWSGFWTMHDKYVLDGPTQTLKKAPQPFYYVGMPATVKKTFSLYASPGKQAVVANAKRGSKVTILLCDDHFNKDMKWYLLKTSDNLIGWIKEETIQDALDGIRWAG